MSDNPQELQQAYLSTLQYLQKLKDRMAAQGLLVKHKPYAPLYVEVTDELMRSEHRQDLLVLISLANHANELGWCFPSLRRLADKTGYARTTVQAALSRLMARDWLRVRMKFNRDRRQYEKDFVISPAVIYIRDEITAEAWTRFAEVQHFDSYDELKHFVTKNHQPYIKPTLVTNHKNQNQEPTPKPSSSSPHQNGEGKKAKASATAQPEPDNTDTASDSAQNSDSSSAANPAVHESPPVPPHPPLPAGFDPKKPMDNPEDEAAAKRLHKMFATLQLRRARQYIARYPRELVLIAAQVAKDSPHVRNPVGKMDSDLRKGLTDSLDNRPLGSDFISGDDAAFIDI